MRVNLGGIVSLSTVDYPGHACITIFFRGCNNQCPWCQNKEYRCGDTPVDVNIIMDLLDEASKFVSAVIFSGGEPLLQINELLLLASYAKSIGLLVGVHTALPNELQKVKHVLDYALISDSTIYPGLPGSHRAVWYDNEEVRYERVY